MKRYKLPPGLQILLIVFILTIAIISFYTGRPKPVNYFNVELYGEITAITKYYRGRYDLELKLSKGKVIILSDYSFENYKDVVKTGDSLVKQSGTNCFYYKRNGAVLAENCKSIREVHEMVPESAKGTP